MLLGLGSKRGVMVIVYCCFFFGDVVVFSLGVWLVEGVVLVVCYGVFGVVCCLVFEEVGVFFFEDDGVDLV